jgi:MSHA pilin protein MshC
LSRTQKGFTIVELITVMVIIGIISAIAIPRLMSGNLFASATYRQAVVAALRHAQKSAVGHRRLVCASFTPTTVTLTIASVNPAVGCDQPLTSPDGSAYASGDSTVTASGPLQSGLFFQPDGQITSDIAGAQPVAGNININSQGAITVNGANGYVE